MKKSVIQSNQILMKGLFCEETTILLDHYNETYSENNVIIFI